MNLKNWKHPKRWANEPRGGEAPSKEWEMPDREFKHS